MEERALGDLLLDCLRPEADAVPAKRLLDLDQDSWRRLASHARRQKVAPLLCDKIRALGVASSVPPASMAALTTAYVAAAGQNMRHYQVLSRICDALQAEGVPVIVLKGAFLAKTVYRHVALRPMGDIDILVPAHALREAPVILSTIGYGPISRRTMERSLRFAAHLPRRVVANRSVAIELHGHILPASHPAAIDTAELWTRAVPATIAGINVLALSPEDLLLHLCGHIAYGHAFSFGLRPYCDIAATIRHYGDDMSWSTVIQRARGWGWDRGVYLSLLLSRDWVGASVPEEALRTLRPAGFDPAFCDSVRSHAFLEVHFEAARLPAPPLARVWACQTWGERLRIVKRGVFVDKRTMADSFGVPQTSLWIYVYYLRRILGLAFRHGTAIARLARREARASRHAAFLVALSGVLEPER